MSISYEAVKVELLDADHRAYDLYDSAKKLKLKSLIDSLGYLIKTLNELLKERDFLKPSVADFRRSELHRLLQDSNGSLRRVEDFILRFVDRAGPPPDLRLPSELSQFLRQHAEDLLHFNLALISEPLRKPSAIQAPPSAHSTPATKEKPYKESAASADIGRKRSVRDNRRGEGLERRPSHKRVSSYGGGGVALPPPINTTAPTPKEPALKAPPSPFQATVEDVPDEGTPDEKTAPHVEEYYMTPPSTDEASSSFTQASAGASKGPANEDISERRGQGSLPKIQPPKLERNESGSDFLSPHDATRPRRGTVEESDEKRWQPPVGDFDLYGTTDDEFDGPSDHSSNHTPLKVESFSAHNTPLDRTQMPSPRPRRSSYSRKPKYPEFPGPNSSKPSPRYSPGHSPWMNNMTYEDDRFKKPGAKEKPSPRPSPRETQQELPVNPRRRAATEARKPRPVSEIPYPTQGMFGTHGGERVFHWEAGAATAGAAAGAFQFSNSEDIFKQFLRGGDPDSDNPFAAGLGLRKDESMRVHTGESPKEKPMPKTMPPPTSLRPDDSMRVHTGESPRDSMQNSMADARSLRDSMRESTGETPKPAGTAVLETKVTEHKLELTLEEIFAGVKKTRIIRDSAADLKKVIEIPVRPGCKAGTTYKFNKISFNADQVVNDLHFIVAYKPHDVFRREGDDLHCTVDIDLLESLVGWERYIDTICGKRRRVRAAEPTGPGWKDYLAGLGMPKSKNPEERGDLVVEVKIKYPASLREDQKEGLRKLLKG